VNYEIEKGRQCCEAISSGVLLVPGSYSGKKGEDVVLVN
jgi:hypothetical protein